MRLSKGRQYVVRPDEVTLRVKPGYRGTLKAHLDFGEEVCQGMLWTPGETEVYADAANNVVVFETKDKLCTEKGAYKLRKASYGGEIVLPASALGITKERSTRVDLEFTYCHPFLDVELI